MNKKLRYRLLQKDLKSVKDELSLTINLFNYNHVCNLFLVKNDKSLRSHQEVHSKNLLALTKGISNVGHDPKTRSFNFSKYKLTKQEESLLSKGLQFAIPSTEIEYTDFMLPLNYYIETSSRKKFLVKILKFTKINCWILPFPLTLKLKVVE